MTNIQVNENTVNYAERPYESDGLVRQAFLHYLARGETSLETKSALLSRSGDRGGCLIPDALLSDIDQQVRSLCPLRSLAHITHTDNESLELLVDRAFADAGWAQGDRAQEASDTEFEKIRIPTHQLFVRPRATQRLLDDSGDDLESWFTTKIAKKMASAENKAFLYGNGQQQPHGLLTTPLTPLGEGGWGRFETVLCASEESATIRDALLRATTALKAEYHPQAAWLISRSVLITIQKMTDPMGRYIWQPSLALGTPPILLGYPVYVSDDLPSLVSPSPPAKKESSESLSYGQDDASQGMPLELRLNDQAVKVPILFGNFEEAYHIVDRSDISVLRDPYSAKPYVEFFATKRVGGEVINFEALKAVAFPAEPLE